MNLMIDNGASACITNDLKNFIGRSRRINQPIKGIAGHAWATHRGTVLWRIEDDTGKVHSININGTYYMAGMPNQILSPQHFAQAAIDHHCFNTHQKCAKFNLWRQAVRTPSLTCALQPRITSRVTETPNLRLPRTLH